jgi:hypothetical protein
MHDIGHVRDRLDYLLQFSKTIEIVMPFINLWCVWSKKKSTQKTKVCCELELTVLGMKKNLMKLSKFFRTNFISKI